MHTVLSRLIFAVLISFAASVSSAATIEVTLVDLEGEELNSTIPGVNNEVRIVAISNATRVTISENQVTSVVQGTAELGSAVGPGNVLTVSFTPPNDPVAFLVLARRFDQGQATAAVPFVVSAGAPPVQKLTITVPRADSYRSMQPCRPTCRPRCFLRRWR